VHAREITVDPVGPYDLRATARGADGVTTRRTADGLTVAIGADGASAVAQVRQRSCGRLEIRLETNQAEWANAELRRILALEVDPSDLIAAHARDPLIGDLLRRCPGLRPLGTGTVAHALLRGFAGQLIAYREAQRIEARVVRAAVGGDRGALRRSPTAAEIIALGPARIAAAGLAERRANALVATLRSFDPERLRTMDDAVVGARLGRQPQIGPWTIGVVGLHGLGRTDLGLVGDLGLMRIVAVQTGCWPEADATAALLEPYAPWRGLASMHLLGHPSARSRAWRERSSAPETIRTSDTRLRRPVLYPLSYGGGEAGG
jgi:DNA-3-methyladenine glycosylase II